VTEPVDGREGLVEEAEQPTAANFGRWLRQERELRGLSRDEVARATRLTATVVDGLESGDAARMPPRGYVYGYLRTYAGALGLDPDDVVLRWQEVEGAEPVAEQPPRSAPVKPIVIAVGVALAGVAAVAVWLLR
jgi:cytoskeletal protein RodZ